MDQNQQDSTPSPVPAASTGEPKSGNRRRFWKRAALFAAIGSVFAVAGAKVMAHGHGHGFGHGGDPEMMRKMGETGLRHMLSRAGASDTQQAKVVAIMDAAFKDLQPMREQHLAARKSLAGLMARPTVDRAALESIRAEQIRLADTASKRMTQAMADSAEVLSPEQRVKLAERMQKFGGRGGPGMGQGGTGMGPAAAVHRGYGPGAGESS
jgi:protein CpxP